MKHVFRRAALCGLSLLLIWLLADTGRVRSAAREALSLCASTVIPALLPFLIVSDLLIALGIGSWLSPRFAPLMHLYRLPGCAGSALLLGLIGGYPTGARTAAELFRQGQLTRQETQQLLTFCNNANPVFFISVLGGGIFHSSRTGLYLWLIHLLSALLAGLLLCRGKTSAREALTGEFPCQCYAFFPALAGALRRGAAAMLSICTCVVFFYVLLTPLRQSQSTAASVLIGLTELFSLLPRLRMGLPDLVLASLCGGFGGLSVLAQTAAVLEDANLSPLPCLRGKALQGVLSALLTLLLSPLLV